MENVKNKTVFISPLDWGLGHATRCVPVIQSLLEKNNNVIIGITPSTRSIFEEEFPELKKIVLPAYNIRYSSVLPLWMKLFLDWRRISCVIKEEGKILDEIISTHKIDIVISDNRFGLYSKKVHNIFITHQLFLKAPFATTIVQEKNKKCILNFDEVWVPDFAEEKNSLSGTLSHGKHFHSNVKYIGPQSRLAKNETVEEKYHYLFLISGPEPQQTILKNRLIQNCSRHPHLNFALVMNSKQFFPDKNVTCYDSPDKATLSNVICASGTVICRSGYSSLMDLFLLHDKKVILVPTPGQTEQEYLASYWKEKYSAKVFKQRDIYKLNFQRLLQE